MPDLHIETDRTILRPYAPADFEDYFAYIMEPELQDMLGLRDVTDRTSASETFRWLLDNRVFIAIVHRESARAIGHICLHPPFEKVAQDPAFQGKTGVSLSFALAGPERGKGIMTEALRAATAHLFTEKQVDYIDCECTPSNIPSNKLQQKLGFRRWGTERADGVELLIHILEA